MKKTTLIILIFSVFLFFPVSASAAEKDGETLYAESWQIPDGETLRMLELLGLSADDAASALSLSPARVWDVLRDVFRSALPDVLRASGTVLGLIVLLRLAGTFVQQKKTEELISVIGAGLIVFTLSAYVSGATRACVSALRATADLFKALLPVFVAAVSLSGSPAAALSMQGVALAFAAFVSAAFAGILPGLSAVSLGLSAAGTLQKESGCARAAALLQKFSTWAAGGVSGLFVAVLSIRNAVAGAADSVAARGLRFFVSSAVPVVGSALGESLNAVIAGVAASRTGIGVLGLLSVALLNLFPLVSLLQWRVAVSFLGFAADLFDDAGAAGFLRALGGTFSMLTALLCFHAAVYVLSLAMTLKGGA